MIKEKSLKIGKRLIEEFIDLTTELNAYELKNKLEDDIKRYYKKRKYLGSRDRKIITQLTFSFYRWKGLLNKLSIYDFLCILVYLDDIQNSYVTSYLCSINADFQNLLNNITKTDYTFIEKFEAIKDHFKCDFDFNILFPSWIISDLPIEHKQSIVLGLQSRAKITLRKTELFGNETFPFNHYNHRFKTAVIIEPQTQILDTDLYKQGKIDIQDIGSQLICKVANPQENETWWDSCAGAGGKALYLAQLMGNKGKIVATDIRSHSLKEVDRRANLQHISIINSLHHDLRQPFQSKEKFDGILIDAPCSGSGTWRRHPAERWTIKESEIKKLNKLQRQFLENVVPHLKNNGVIIYATCSILISENESVVEDFLKKHSNFKLEPFYDPLELINTSGMTRSFPNKYEADGMFVARLRKLSN